MQNKLLIDPEIQVFDDYSSFIEKLNAGNFEFLELGDGFQSSFVDQEQRYSLLVLRENLTSRKKFLKGLNIEWILVINSDDQFDSHNLTGKNIIEFRRNDLSSVVDLWSLMADQEQLSVNNYFLSAQFAQYEKILKTSNKYISEMSKVIKRGDIGDDEVALFNRLNLKIVELNEAVAHLFDESELLNLINSSLESTAIKSVGLADELVSDENLLVVSLPGSKKSKFALFEIEDDANDSNENAYFITSLVDLIIKFFSLKKDFQNLKSEYSLWEEGFSKVSLPVALISDEGELLLHNNAFSKLEILPHECLEYSNDESVEKGQVIYKIYRKDLHSKQQASSYFVFLTDESLSSVNLKNISSQELGIISGSIAHELNNPLAGILAAIALLQLEDDWDDDAEKALDEMKKGAQRCKQLIDIFLGFSKKIPNAMQTASFNTALTQAINLLRFRMIESNVRVEISIEETNERFEKNCNVAVLAMIFYLIFSEVITEFLHQKLISAEISNLGNIVNGQFFENKDQVTIYLDKNLDLSSRVSSSKLIQYLVELETLKLDMESNKISFIFAPTK